MKWPDTKLTEKLGIRYPIIQAPMANDVTTPELVAAVSNAGGLGSLGAGYMEPEDIRRAIRAIRTLTDKPFAVNLFIPEAVTEDAERIIRANELLAPYRRELGLPEVEPLAAYLPDYTEQLGVLFEESVKILSFTFGVPAARELESIQQQGMITLGTATHLLEAILLEESGVDIVVAQGIEAGGPRATFLGSCEQGLVGSMVLLPLLQEYLTIPFVAAGGIMNGRGILAALALGAGGVQMGTAFLTTPESGAHAEYKELLPQATEITTTLTRVFSGKPARGLKNRFIEELQQAEAYLPGYPIQNALTREIRQAAAEQNNVDFMSLWAGQGCPLCRDKAAAKLMAYWIEQVEELLAER
jgi:nitronate monooxygenase